jgi:hypothetical protein
MSAVGNWHGSYIGPPQPDTTIIAHGLIEHRYFNNQKQYLLRSHSDA